MYNIYRGRKDYLENMRPGEYYRKQAQGEEAACIATEVIESNVHRKL